MDQIKTKERVEEYGEVFTPKEIVNAMLDLVKPETERIDSRFLEPACGSGNFLVEVLRRKLDAVESKYGASESEKKLHSIQSMMCIYGIELLPDNVAECRGNLLQVLGEYFDLDDSDDFTLAAKFVMSQNIVQGDAIKYLTKIDPRMNKNEQLAEFALLDPVVKPIEVPEWGKVGIKFQRRDFDLKEMMHRKAIRKGIEHNDPQTKIEEIFAKIKPDYESTDYLRPIDRVYPLMGIRQLAEEYVKLEESK
jgi:hypothetical protein